MKNIEKILSDLEKVELETTNEAVPSQIYSQLLAVYLFQNELCFAKHLWKRIPVNIKNNPDIRNIWIVAQKMWLRDWSAVHAALNVEWNKNVADIMNALKDRIRERAFLLIGDAYSSLDISTLANMTGLSYQQSEEMVKEKGWTISGSIVKPLKQCKKQNVVNQETMTENQLHTLTKFVSFLEN